MKTKLLFAVIVAAFLNLPCWSQSATCGTALSISNGITNRSTSNQAANWGMFTATQITHKLVVYMETDTVAPDLDSIFVYSGSCSGLTPIYSAVFPLDGSIVFTLSSLTVSNNYFIYTKRKPACKTCSYSTRVISYYVQTTASACADMVGNGSFESNSGLPSCGPSYPNIMETWRFTVGLAARWTTQYNTINDYYNNPTTYASSSDYFNTASGTLPCINFMPIPRTGFGHAGMGFTSDQVNGIAHKEMIISDDGTLVPIINGTTYCLTYYYKKVDGTASFTVGAAFTGSLIDAVTTGGTGTQAVIGYQTPAANGWTRVDCYMTAQWTGACLFSIQFLSAGLALNQLNYIMVDDVSMVESVGLAAQSGLTACMNTNMFFQAYGSATSYNWSVTPSTGLNLFPAGSSCIGIATAYGTYTITVSGNTPSGCTSAASIAVTINPSPSVSVTPTVPAICSNNGSVTLTASPNFTWYTYQWYSQATGLITGANTYTYQTSIPGTYYVVVTNSGCMAQSNMVTASAYPSPTVTASSTDEHCDDANDGTAHATASNGTGPYTYLWSALPVQTTATATGLGNGTYTITITDANGCTATGTVSVGTSTISDPVITTDATNGNLCNSNTVTYTISNYNSAYTYSALYSVPPLSVTNPLTNLYVVTWPSSCNDVVFTLNAYNGIPYCSGTASVTLFGCCGACNLTTGDATMDGSPAHDDLNDFLNDYNPANSPTGIIYHTGTLPYNWFYNNPNQVLYFDGTFNVDAAIASSFTFLPGSEVRMGPNAKILMTGTLSCTININQSHFSAGCNYMWDGIYELGTNKTINVQGSATQASLIEDAQNGIVSAGGANFTFDNAVFNKCYWSAQASLYASNHPATIKNTVFTCRSLIFTALQVSSMKGTSTSTCQPGQRPVGAYQTAVLLAPYAGRRSYGAVFLNNLGSTTVDPITHQITAWTYITIGTGNTTNFADLNIMDNMDYGVYAQNSNAIVFNNHFQNLSGPPAVNKTTPNYGIGVYGINDELNFSKRIIIGDLISRNSFYDCNRAVDLNGYYDASIIGNCFLSNNVYAPGSLTQSPYGNYGIFVKSGRYINTEIANNEIINWSFGIAFFSEYLLSGTSYTRSQGALLIHDNEIKPVVSGLPTTQFVGTAITAQSLTPCGSCSATQSIWGTPRIEHNIGIVDVFNGIDVQGWPELTIVTDNVITLRYQPNYFSTVYKQAGIRSITTTGVVIYRNDISGDLATGKPFLRGIYAINNANVKVRCNTTTNVGQSLVFDGLNNGPVEKNIMNSAGYGLVLLNNGIIGQQGSPVIPNLYPQGVASDNQWIGPFAIAETVVDATSCATNSKIYVRGGYPYTPAVNVGTILCLYDPGNFSINVLNGSPLSFDCTTAPGIIGDDGDEDGSRIMLMEKTAQDSITIGDYATETSWTNKQVVYEMLKQDSTLMNDSPVLQEFYSVTDSTNIGKVTTTGILLTQTNTDSAASVNQTINPELQIEQNYKDLDNIYISLMDGIPSDSMQLQALEAIAIQCPQQGGLAVYRARVLLNVLYDDVRYWDDNCASSERTGNNEEATTTIPVSEGIDLYPNPNDGTMTLSYNLPAEQQGQFVIYDVMGNTVAKTKLENGLTQKQIDLTQLAPGIYYYRVTFNGVIIKTDKIIIVK